MNIVFYDGDCGLCNSFVFFILQNDKNNIFHFSSLQGKLFQSIKSNYFSYKSVPDAVIFLKENKIFIGYKACLEIFFIIYS